MQGLLGNNEIFKQHMFPDNATTDFDGKILMMENPVKGNSLFEVKTNVQTKLVVVTAK